MVADTLHSRLRSTITERLRVAQAATPGPWTTPGPRSIGQWMVYDADWCVATASAYDHDIYSYDDPRHSCCIDDCPCGPDDPDPDQTRTENSNG